MSKIVHIDGKDRLIAKLEETIQNVRDGKTVGVAWVERCGSGGCSPHYWSLSDRNDACRLVSGHYVGVELLRNGISYLAACMDHDALVDAGEASG